MTLMAMIRKSVGYNIVFILLGALFAMEYPVLREVTLVMTL